MRRYVEPSNGLALLSPFRSWPGYIINTSGYDFRKGQSPWQNGIAKSLIGTLRRECLDQMIICGEAHLRRILSAYAEYYNQARTHLALQKGAPTGAGCIGFE